MTNKCYFKRHIVIPSATPSFRAPPCHFERSEKLAFPFRISPSGRNDKRVLPQTPHCHSERHPVISSTTLSFRAQREILLLLSGFLPLVEMTNGCCFKRHIVIPNATLSFRAPSCHFERSEKSCFSFKISLFGRNDKWVLLQTPHCHSERHPVISSAARNLVFPSRISPSGRNDKRVLFQHYIVIPNECEES